MIAPCRLPRRGGELLRLSFTSLTIAGFLVASLGGTASGQTPPPAPRTVLITVDGTSIQDWLRADAFASLEAISLLATRTHAPSDDPRTLRASAYASLGAGTAAEMSPGSRPTDAGDDVLAGALGEALAQRGLLATALGDASGIDGTDAPAPLGAMRADGTVAVGPSMRVPAIDPPKPMSRPDDASPGGRRTDHAALRSALRGTLAWASFVIVDLGDTARADRVFGEDPAARRPWIDRALADANAFVADARALLGPRDTVMVASLVPPQDRTDHGRHLGAFAIAPGRGLATSGTTRRAGVLSLTDIAPTIAARAGASIPAEMTGRVASITITPDPRRTVVELDTDLVRALSSRILVTRSWLFVTAALAVLSFLTISAGRGRRGGAGRFPRTWRDVLFTGLLTAAAGPAAMLVAPALPGNTVVSLAVWTAVVAAGGALVARIILGSERALLAVGLGTAGIIGGDLIAGTPLGSRSPIAFQIAGGGRFYGIDEALLGVLLASSLVAAGIWLDRTRDRRRGLLGLAVGLGLVALIAGAPSLGSKFGAPFTLVPAFGVFLVLAQERRIDREAIIAVAAATVLIAASLAAADTLASPESRSHIGRELTGGAAPGALIARKLSSLVRITFTTIWLPVSIVVTGGVALLCARRTDLAARAFWGKPARRAALRSLVVGFACALASNDTGIMTVATAAAVAAAGFYEPLLMRSPPPTGVGKRAAGAGRERRASGGPVES